MRLPTFLRRYADLLACIVAAAVAMGLAIGAVTGIPTVLFGGLLVLLIPGYALGCALWDSDSDLTIGDRIAFTVGLSVSVSIFDVLALSLGGIGIFPLTVTILLAYETIVFSLLAFAFRSARDQGLPHEMLEAAALTRSVLRADKGFWAVVSVLLVSGAVLIALIVSVPTPAPSPQFYVVGPDGTTSTLPTTLVVNQTSTVLVGAENGQAQPVTFTVHVCLGPPTGACSGPPATDANWTSVLSFAPNQSYVMNLSVAGQSKAEEPLRFIAIVPGSYALDLSLDAVGVHKEVRLPILVTP